ncbi:hypothetical protein L7F22_039022 [Adiantum nelumboides]|nr:hypothetical protein [Adiantum nelumboides]
MSVLRAPIHDFLPKQPFKASDIVLRGHYQEHVVRVIPAIRRYSTTTTRGFVIENRETILNDNQSRTKEEEMTVREKDWTISEEDARPPKIILPILFFLAIGTSAFYVAAFMNNKTNDDMVQCIRLYPVVLENFNALFLSLPENDYLEKLQNRYDSINYGDTNVKWGDFTEAQLRSVKAKNDFLKANHFNFLDKIILQVSYLLGIPQISLAYQNIKVKITQFPDEIRVGLPIICTAAAVLVESN